MKNWMCRKSLPQDFVKTGQDSRKELKGKVWSFRRAKEAIMRSTRISIPRKEFWRASSRTMLALILLSSFFFVCFSLLASTTAEALPITITDDAGPDDEPGQKDLNQLTVDFEPSNGYDLDVTWNWDTIMVSGANTGDACSLYDTDNDGNANFSLCVVWDNGSSYSTTRLYSCGDNAADRCGNPRELLAEDKNFDSDIADQGEYYFGVPYASECSLAKVNDTFGSTGRGSPQADTEFDTQALCGIELDDFGTPDAFLINVCSYPSQVPGSDPSDCVVTPNSGFLTIVKVADPNNPDYTFTFNLGADQAANDGRTSFSIKGSGSVNLIAFAAGTGYDLSEVVPDGWLLDSASCTLSNEASTGAFESNTNTVSNFEIQVGRETICTFIDIKPPTLKLLKTVVNDDGGTMEADDFQAYIGSEQVPWGIAKPVSAGSFTASEDKNGSYTASEWGGDCAADGTVQLENGEEKECSITNDDKAAHLKLVKVVINDNGGTAKATDWTLSASGPTPISGAGGVENDVDAGTYTLSESGGPVGYTAGSWICEGGQQLDNQITLALGQSATCTLTNNDQQAYITVVKNVINDNGGSALPGDFNLTLGGNAVISGVAVPVNPGTHTAGETPLPGYTFQGFSGECDSNGAVTVALGESKTCTLTNDDTPGGEPRTIGFWKNWNTCTGGNQDQSAASVGGPDAGRYLLDDLLENPGYTIGKLELGDGDCLIAVKILDKRKSTGEKMASDAAYNLAAQLLAAKLNLSAGAETCQEAVDAVNAGQALLETINFNGTRNYLRPRDARYPAANQLAATLDRYNNGNLCTP